MGLALDGGDPAAPLADPRALTRAILLYPALGGMRRRSDGPVPAEDGAEL